MNQTLLQQTIQGQRFADAKAKPLETEFLPDPAKIKIHHTRLRSVAVAVMSLIILITFERGTSWGQVKTYNGSLQAQTNNDPPAFTPGRLVVLKTTTTISKSSSPVVLQEISTSGIPGATVIIPSSVTDNFPFQTSGVYGGSEGFLTNSTDGRYLMMGGYGTSSIFTDITATASLSVPRVIGEVTQSGCYVQAGTSNTFFNQNDIRGCVSDGVNFWASGASSAGIDGIDYFGPGIQAGLGTLATNPPKAYGLRIFGGSIYFSTQKQYNALPNNNFGIFKVTGSPTANPVTITQVINTGANIPEDFSFNPTLDVCYIAINLNSSNGGIQKWTKTAGVWSLAYTLGTGTTNIGAYGLIADYSVPATPVLYATTFENAGNRVIKITDNGSAASSPSTTLVSAVTGVYYKGISFSPVDSGIPVVNLTISTNTGSEAGATAITVTAWASSPVTSTQTVSLGVSGAGITTGDYTLSNSTITIPAGYATGTVTFTVVDDAILEPTEIAILTISNPSAGLVLGLTTSQSISILDNDNTAPTISINTATTSDYVDGGATISPASPFTLSGVIADSTDPGKISGIDFAIFDAETAAPGLTLTATSSNTAVVPNANLALTGTGSIRNLKITPVGVGYSNISVTVSDGVNNTTYLVAYAASARTPDIFPARTFWHTGMSDASDGIALDDNYYMSGDDEFDYINVYSRYASGSPLVSYDYSSNLALPDPAHPEVDVEAATQSPSVSARKYWSGSMSNGASPFPNKPNRDRLFATNVTGTGSSTAFNFGGYVNLRIPLLAWGDANGYNFTASAAAGVDSKAPNGLSLEGMVFGPDNTTLYLGMRAPLVPTTNRTNAVIAPILNFETWFNNGNPSGNPTFGAPIELNLGNRGIRDIIRLSNGTYILIAGDPGEILPCDIFKWTGYAADAPVLVPSAATGVLKMEGLIPVYTNSQLSLSQMQVVTDGGDVVLYNDGFAAKDLVARLRKFRSDVLTGLDLDICTGFTATITTNGNTTFCQGGSVTLTAAGGTNVNNTYLWSNGSTASSVTVNSAGTYTVTVNHAGLCTSTASVLVTVNPLGQVNQPLNQVVCNGSNTTAVIFGTTNTGGTTTYAWTNNNPGIGLAASGTGNIAIFTVSNSGTAPAIATITVTPVYSNGGISCSGPSKTFTITVNPTAQVNQPANQVVCSNTTTAGITFGTGNSGGTTTYSWTNSTPSIGLAATGAGNIAAFTAVNTGNAPVVATVVVTPTFTNGSTSCSGTGKTFNITVNPLPVPAITGTASLCVNSGYYNYVTGAGMSNYTWTISAGGAITSGQGTNSLMVSWNSTGAQWVAVTYTNTYGCNASGPTLLNISVNPLPAAAGVITGTAAICAGMTGVAYSVGPVQNALSYVWSLPPGASVASGNGTSNITVNYQSNAVSGNITVAGNNLCGNGALSPNFQVTVNALPTAAGAISGSGSECQGTTGVIYTVPPVSNATSYVWSVPAGAAVVSGSTTNTITVNYGMNAVSGNIAVYASNSCGNGTVSPSLTVTVNPIPSTPLVTTAGDILTSSAPAGNQWYYQGSPLPGATGKVFHATQTGWYWTVVTLNGCSSDSSHHHYILMVGEPQLVAGNVEVYPVPNDGRFTVSLTNFSTEAVNIEVYSNLGMRIYELENVRVPGRLDQVIDIRPAAGGLYTIVIRNSRLEIVKKLIISR